jgi:hypothetical protein
MLTASVGSVRAQSITVALPTSADPSVQSLQVSPQQTSLLEVRAIAPGVREALRDVALRGAFDPAITGSTAAPMQGVSFEVGEDGATIGKAKLSWRIDDYSSAVDVVLRSPIKQSTGVPLTDRGLADGASITLGYNLALWGSAVPTAVSGSTIGRIQTTGNVSLTPLEALVATGLAVQAAPERTYADPRLQALSTSSAQDAFRERSPRAIAFALHHAGAARLNRTVLLRGSYGVGSRTFTFAQPADPLVEQQKRITERTNSVGGHSCRSSPTASKKRR